MIQTTAKIVADSISVDGYRLTTFEITYPRFILAELNTHRMLAKSTASSRAIPTAKLIEMVETNPFVPKSFSKNKAGMQGDGSLDDTQNAIAQQLWMVHAANAARMAQNLLALSAHKQHANRVLEPFLYARTVITGTEWDNFFALRNSPMAQPEFQELAEMMQDVLVKSSPACIVADGWHMPYSDDVDPKLSISDRLSVSAARCARVSYKTHDGVSSQLDKDIELGARLLAEGHMSPFDHQATPLAAGDTAYDQRHLVGWVPYRVMVEKAHGMLCRRSPVPAQEGSV